MGKTAVIFGGLRKLEVVVQSSRAGGQEPFVPVR